MNNFPSLFFITITWNTCLLPIVPFNQYLSVGIVINRHNGILFQTGAKKKKKKSRRIDLEKSRRSRFEPRRESNREGRGNSFVRGSTRDQWGKKKREREKETRTEIESPISWTDKIRLFVHTLRITVGFVDCSASSRSLPPPSSLSENNDLSGQIGWLGLEV